MQLKFRPEIINMVSPAENILANEIAAIENMVVRDKKLIPAGTPIEILQSTNTSGVAAISKDFAVLFSGTTPYFLYEVGNVYKLHTATAPYTFINAVTVNYNKNRRIINDLIFFPDTSTAKYAYILAGQLTLANFGCPTLEDVSQESNFSLNAITTSTVSFAFSGTGTFRYRVALLRANAVEDVESNGSVKIVDALQLTTSWEIRVNLPASGSEYNKARLYRKEPAGTFYKQIAEVTLAGSPSVYVDQAATASDLSIILEDNDRLTGGITDFTIFKNRVWALVEGTNRLKFSKIDDVTIFPDVNEFNIGSSQERGWKLYTDNDTLFVVKQNSIFTVSGTDITDFKISKFSDFGASVSALVGGRLLLARTEGLFIVNGNTLIKISDPIAQQGITYVYGEPVLHQGVDVDEIFYKAQNNLFFIYNLNENKWIGTAEFATIAPFEMYFKESIDPQSPSMRNSVLMLNTHNRWYKITRASVTTSDRGMTYTVKLGKILGDPTKLKLIHSIKVAGSAISATTFSILIAGDTTTTTVGTVVLDVGSNRKPYKQHVYIGKTYDLPQIIFTCINTNRSAIVLNEIEINFEDVTGW